MKVHDIIRVADEIRPNVIDTKKKERWIRTLDDQLKRIFCPACSEDESFIPSPPDELFLYYLILHIDLEEYDAKSFEYIARLFHHEYQKYASDYLRSYKA